MTQYHVEYVRTRRPQRARVSTCRIAFDGGVTVTVSGRGTVPFTLVRIQAKQEAPLKALAFGGGANAISTIATVTFYGHDQNGPRSERHRQRRSQLRRLGRLTGTTSTTYGHINLSHRVDPAPVAALLLTACTVQKQETPALTGPSELSTSHQHRGDARRPVAGRRVAVAGARSRRATSNGQPMRNLSLRAEIAVNGVLADFGRCRPRTSSPTRTAGRPSSTPRLRRRRSSTDNGTHGADPGRAERLELRQRHGALRQHSPRAAERRHAAERSQGVVHRSRRPRRRPTTPSSSMRPRPSAQNPGTTIVSYEWDFGDGAKATGRPGVAQVRRRFLHRDVDGARYRRIGPARRDRTSR